MERGKLWRTAFGNNVRLLELNGAGLTPELAAKRPASGVASAAWIVGHLVMTRRRRIQPGAGTMPAGAREPAPTWIGGDWWRRSEPRTWP